MAVAHCCFSRDSFGFPCISVATTSGALCNEVTATTLIHQPRTRSFANTLIESTRAASCLPRIVSVVFSTITPHEISTCIVASLPKRGAGTRQLAKQKKKRSWEKNYEYCVTTSNKLNKYFFLRRYATQNHAHSMPAWLAFSFHFCHLGGLLSINSRRVLTTLYVTSSTPSSGTISTVISACHKNKRKDAKSCMQ